MLKKFFSFTIFVLIICTACHHDALQTIHPNKDQMGQLYDLGQTTALGKPDAPITMVEVFSYDCRYCRQDYPLLAHFVIEHPEVRIIFKPFKAFGDSTKVLAQYAALAANKQGKFLLMHERLITTSLRLNERNIKKIAEKLNLNMNEFEQDIKSPAIKEQIEQNTELMDQLDIDGIPALIVTKTALINDLEHADNIPQYIQVGFLSHDVLINLLRKTTEKNK